MPSMPADPIRIQFENVDYAIGAGRELLHDITLEVRQGEMLVLLGRSGSGKTTMLKLVNRLLEPTSGTIRVSGKDTTSWDPIHLRRQIGYVIQDVGLFPHFNVERNVGLVPTLESWPPDRIAARVDELMELVGLPPETFAGRYPHELSGGQRQTRRCSCSTNLSARWIRLPARKFRKSSVIFTTACARP
jgi:osmoprotectant transport system ATP-binding protein